MNILHTPARFFPSVGGVESDVLTLARALIKKKQNICVICADEPQEKRKSGIMGVSGLKKYSPLAK